MDSTTLDNNSWLLFLSLFSKCTTTSTTTTTTTLLILLLVILFAAILHWSYPGGPAWGKYLWNNNKHSSIPGPRGLPFIGSMRLMSGLAHRHLASAAISHDATKLMSFSLGSTRVIITSDVDVAREILNSAAFADRPIKQSAYSLLFHRAIGFAPYGVYWRSLRRISANHLFSPKQIATTESTRAVIVNQMIGSLRGRAGEVNVREVLKTASLNNVMWSVFGRKYGMELTKLRELVEEGYDLLGKLNWGDHVPFLARFDLQRIRFRCSRLVPKVNEFVGRIIEEHRFERIGEGEKPVGDFVDVLLSLQGGDRLSDSDMVAVLWEMIFRGTDTIAVLIEWTLARLVIHKDVQSKVHDELDRVVGNLHSVTESHTSSLPYLQAVLKEVLRMHPPGPLLSWARLSTSDVHVDGRIVPAGTTAMVNMWAITHNPQVWKDPLEFRPERFMDSSQQVGSEFSIFGSDLRLAPFGSGRRSCPGKALAMATVSFWVATLLHEYKWLPGKHVDLSEVLRLSCEMADPLTVNLNPRHR